MKKLFLSISFLLVCSSSVLAIPFSLTNVGSDDVSNISASVDNLSGGGGVKISVDVSSRPVIADITGIFFDLAGLFVGTNLVTTAPFANDQAEGSIQMAPNNSNMGGSVPNFDVGVAIGNTGLTDDYQMVMFDVLGTGLDASAFTRFGVRLLSVGSGTSRGGSAKYVGGPGQTSVPEPATLALFGFGLLGLAGLSRKRISKRN